MFSKRRPFGCVSRARTALVLPQLDGPHTRARTLFGNNSPCRLVDVFSPCAKVSKLLTGRGMGCSWKTIPAMTEGRSIKGRGFYSFSSVSRETCS